MVFFLFVVGDYLLLVSCMFVIGDGVGVVCMAGLGSKALQSRRARERGGGGVVVEVGQMGEGDLPFRRGGDKRGKNRKNRMERGGKHRDVHKEKPPKISNGAIDQKVLKQQNAELKTTVLRSVHILAFDKVIYWLMFNISVHNCDILRQTFNRHV